MIKHQIPYKKIEPCDVLVAGGGSAGVAAAVAAARSGAKVTLIEKNTFLGGVATGGLVTPMMKNISDTKGILTQGLFLEICNRLEKASGGAVFKDGNPGWFNPEIYKIVLDEICTESKVNLIFDSQIVDVEKIDNKIKKVFFFNKSGLLSVSAKEFIDTTGDGDLLKYAGISFDEGVDGKRQAISLRFLMSGVNIKELSSWLTLNDTSGDSPIHTLDTGDILLTTAFTFERDWVLKPFFEQAISAGVITKNDANYFQIFSIPNARGMIAFNCPRLLNGENPLNPLDYKDTSYALTEGRQMIKRLSNFCIKYLPGFQDSYVCQIAPLLGIRETRRLQGEYILNTDDILTAKKFNDSIANSNWPIDIHPSKINEKGQLRHPPKGDFYQIPIRALLPLKSECENLIVAGRLLSSTFEAQGSARIQPNCWAMGEAAGKLSAQRIKDNI